jgi:hypothetical protein
MFLFSVVFLYVEDADDDDDDDDDLCYDGKKESPS